MPRIKQDFGPMEQMSQLPFVQFNSIEDVRKHEWIGNAYHDGNAFAAIDSFVRNPNISVDDKYEAIEIMGVSGMGLKSLNEEYPEMSKQEMIDIFLEI